MAKSIPFALRKDRKGRISNVRRLVLYSEISRIASKSMAVLSKLHRLLEWLSPLASHWFGMVDQLPYCHADELPHLFF